MQDFVFRNKWVLLATAIVMLVGVSWLVGREDDQGTLAQPQSEASNLGGTALEGTAQNPPPNIIRHVPTATDDDTVSDDDGDSYADDNDLIETPEGYDPSPSDGDQSNRPPNQVREGPPSEIQAGNNNGGNGSDSGD